MAESHFRFPLFTGYVLSRLNNRDCPCMDTATLVQLQNLHKVGDTLRSTATHCCLPLEQERINVGRLL